MKTVSSLLLLGAAAVTAQTTDDYADLDAAMDGNAFLPGTDGFEEFTGLKNPRLEDRLPATALVATSVHDVQLAVNFTRTHGKPFSVKSTGHCYNGNCMAKSSLHLDVSSMNSITIEEDGTEIMARAGPGVVFQQLYAACEEYGGIVAAGGMGSTVGLVGYSSGGGHGPLSRHFGLGADQLISVTLVQADGSVIVADANQNSDVFWAVRGGGGGTWGVQVETVYRLHRAPNVYSLSCFYPMTKDSGAVDVGTPVLAAFLGTSMTRDLPDEWGVYAMATRIPFQPEALDGFDFGTMAGSVQFEGVFVGDATLAEATASAEPLTSFMAEHQTSCVVREEASYLQWHTSKSATMDPSGDLIRGYMESAFIDLDTLGGGGGGTGTAGEELASIIVDSTLELPLNSWAAWFGVHLGGKVKTIDVEDSAISTAFRMADILLSPTANWLRDRDDETETTWGKEQSLRMHAVEGVSGQYLNEANPDEENFAEMFWDVDAHARLQAVKAEVDPANIFACWQCVEPASI